MEIMKSKVYIQTDAAGHVTRCEGGYTTPADLTDWTEIDEGIGDRYNLCQSHYFEGGLYTSDGVCRYKYTDGVATLRPEEEIEADRTAALYTPEAVRAQRDELLADTDWTQVLDAPIDAQSREAYRTYRQALRDVPEQEGFPAAVVWPKLPEIVKAEPDPVDEAFDTLIGGDDIA